MSGRVWACLGVSGCVWACQGVSDWWATYGALQAVKESGTGSHFLRPFSRHDLDDRWKLEFWESPAAVSTQLAKQLGQLEIKQQ